MMGQFGGSLGGSMAGSVALFPDPSRVDVTRVVPFSLFSEPQKSPLKMRFLVVKTV